MQSDIKTDRLLLRPFRFSDCDRVAALANEKIISDMTTNMPHPYNKQMAREWISNHEAITRHGKGIVYAITIKGRDEIIGAVSFPEWEQGRGILGYWLGVPYWGKGYAYEASRYLIKHCYQHHNLTEVEAAHLAGNERSKAVIKKLNIEFIRTETRVIRGESYDVFVYHSPVLSLIL